MNINRPRDLEKLQGWWDVLRILEGGKEHEQVTGQVVSIEGSRLTFHTMSDSGSLTSEIHIDSTKSPIWLDEVCPNGGTCEGIIEIQGEGFWKHCYQGLPDRMRPTNFSAEDGGHVCYVFRRRPKNEPPPVVIHDPLPPHHKIPHVISEQGYRGYRICKYREFVDLNKSNDKDYFNRKKIYETKNWWTVESSTSVPSSVSGEMKRFESRLDAEFYVDSIIGTG